MMHHEPVPDEQHDHCTNGRANKASPLIKPIPADDLANKGGDECSNDPEHSCENKA
jgi:hypothetical protein